MSDRLICSVGIDEALSLLVRNKVDLGYEANEALDTLCLWVELKLKQERDEWERDEDYTRSLEIHAEWEKEMKLDAFGEQL